MTADDGSTRHLSLILAPSPQAGGPDGMLALLQDISEEVKLREMHRTAEREAVLARRAAEQADAAKTLFLANISHEFRTPMNAIIGFSELISMKLTEDDALEKISEYNDLIFRAGRHLLSLIEDVLDISSIELGSVKLQPTELDFWKTVDDAVRLFDERTKAAGVAITTEPSNEEIRIRADERSVRQIVINLVSNAVKFTPEGGQVVVSVSRDEAGFATLVVRDTGIGIDAADLDRVRQPFERVLKTRAESVPGVGLGLHLVNVLVGRHGGSLDIASEPGVGTTVTVRLPITE